MKTIYLLHGGYPKVRNELNKKFYQRLQRDLPDGANLLLVYFSRPLEKVPEIFEMQKVDLAENTRGKKIHYEVATEENFLEQLKNADAIYLHGGDTHRLLDIVKRFPEFSELIKGKVVGGSSAGAYILASWAFNNDTQEIIQGLGILPIMIHAHHKGEQEVINILNTIPGNLELILIPDYETREYIVEE